MCETVEVSKTGRLTEREQKIAYEVYKLWWLILHGYTFSEVLQSILEYRNLFPDENELTVEDLDVINDAEKLLESWEFEEGIGGNIYSSYEEFVKEDLPVLMKDVMFATLCRSASKRYSGKRTEGDISDE